MGSRGQRSPRAYSAFSFPDPDRAPGLGGRRSSINQGFQDIELPTFMSSVVKIHLDTLKQCADT
jgi:hypothetical protein